MKLEKEIEIFFESEFSSLHSNEIYLKVWNSTIKQKITNKILDHNKRRNIIIKFNILPKFSKSEIDFLEFQLEIIQSNKNLFQ